MTLMLFAAAVVQGAELNAPTLPFIEPVQSILPYLRGRSLAGILMTVSHFIFAFHFGLMLPVQDIAIAVRRQRCLPASVKRLN